jgi:GxxExxY protein
MTENDIAKIVVDLLIKIHRKTGPGLYESIYEKILCHELDKVNLKYERQASIKVVYDDIDFNFGYKADLIIENKVILELKSVENVLPVHGKQLLTYLRLTGIKLGLLVNFNESLMKDGISRIMNGTL